MSNPLDLDAIRAHLEACQRNSEERNECDGCGYRPFSVERQEEGHYAHCPVFYLSRCSTVIEALHEALALVLPLAKGHAAEHPVGSNGQYVLDAEAALARVTGGEDA